MTENQNLPPSPDPANLTPHEHSAYEKALKNVLDDARAEAEGLVGYLGLQADIDGCETEEEVADAYEEYPESLQENASEVEEVLSSWGRTIPPVLEANTDDWGVYDAFSFRISEGGFDPVEPDNPDGLDVDPYAALEGTSSDAARQAIRLTQDHMVLSEAQGRLSHGLPSPEEFTAFVSDNASSPEVARVVREALDWYIWAQLPTNEHGVVFTEQEQQARLSLLSYVSSPEARKDMELALEHYGVRVSREQTRVLDAMHSEVGKVALTEALEPQRGHDSQN